MHRLFINESIPYRNEHFVDGYLSFTSSRVSVEEVHLGLVHLNISTQDLVRNTGWKIDISLF